jgi:hypothetical protein
VSSPCKLVRDTREADGSMGKALQRARDQLLKEQKSVCTIM